MRLFEAMELAKEAGAKTYADVVDIISSKATSIFKYEHIHNEIDELMSDMKRKADDMNLTMDNFFELSIEDMIKENDSSKEQPTIMTIYFKDENGGNIVFQDDRSVNELEKEISNFYKDTDKIILTIANDGCSNIIPKENILTIDIRDNPKYSE